MRVNPQLVRTATPNSANPPPHLESTPVEDKGLVGVRAAFGERKTAEHGQVNVRVVSYDLMPEREVQTALFQARLQGQQGIRRANFLQGQDVRFQG